MGRRRRAENTIELDARIGARVAWCRLERGWTQTELAARLDLSGAQISALEAGQHGFSAALLVRTGQVLGRSPGYFLAEEAHGDENVHPWRQLYDALQERDRAIVLDLARKLAYWPETSAQRPRRRAAASGPRFIAVEGIDGTILEAVGAALGARGVAGTPTVYAPHDYRTPLWKYMLSRLQGLELLPHGAFERTLWFASERLHRQESTIRPALARGCSVVAPYMSMAPAVFQEVEGSPDRRLIDIVETLILRPDLIVLVRSDPELAARRATCGVPRKGTFFSQYTTARDFADAQALYKQACKEFSDRGYEILDVDCGADPEAAIDEIVENIVHSCRGAAVS